MIPNQNQIENLSKNCIHNSQQGLFIRRMVFSRRFHWWHWTKIISGRFVNMVERYKSFWVNSLEYKCKLKKFNIVKNNSVFLSFLTLFMLYDSFIFSSVAFFAWQCICTRSRHDMMRHLALIDWQFDCF